MVRVLMIFLLLLFFAPAANAQGWEFKGMPYPIEETEPKPLGEVIEEPVCFNVVNKTEHGVRGTVATNYFIRGDGVRTRWSNNFRLKPEEKVNFCTRGPFFEGGRVELIIRTLVPIFSCYTTITEDIEIHSERRADDRGYDVWADCR